VIATSTYIDPALSRLGATARDAEQMSAVLGDPQIGGFEVTLVTDCGGREIREQVEDFLTRRSRDDVVVVYLSCHGIIDARDRLYFAATDTRRDRLAATGVESAWLLDRLEECRAASQVVILDCCFSGAFDRGAKGGDDGPRLQQRFPPGRGRAVLTAETAQSWEGDLADGVTGPSEFTRALAEGLRTGAADTDGDGYISVEDAYRYAYDVVVATGAGQTLQLHTSRGAGHLLLARSPVMESEDLLVIRRRELAELLYYLSDTDAPDASGVLLLGASGTGKTTLLRLAAEDLKKQGRAVFFVSFAKLRDPGDPVEPGDLGSLTLTAVASSPFIGAEIIERTLRTSAGPPPIREAAEILGKIGSHLISPVLLFDALDESDYPQRMTAAIEELSLALDGWKIAVSSRPEAAAEFRHFARFAVIHLRGFTEEDSAALLRTYAPGISGGIIPRIVELTGGNPLLLRIMAREFQRLGSLAEIADITSLEGVLEQLVNQAVSSSPSPEKLSELLEDLALAGGRDRITSLVSKSQVAEEEVWRLLDSPDARVLLVLDNSAGTAEFFHATVGDVILSRRILALEFRLSDLKFGAEEAERDELLDDSFVPRPGTEAILDQRRSIIVGDRGSGKSAIFHKLSKSASATGDRPSVEIRPVTSTGDLLHRVVDKDAWLDTDELRAAWLVVVASEVALAVLPLASKKFRRNAALIRAAFGMTAEPASLARRVFGALGGLVGGTTLTFAVGPVNLEAKLPSGSGGKPSKASVDIESFLREADSLLRESAQRVVVMFDRIDETFKYDRAKQEAVVQGLVQAEGQVSLFECIGLIVFLRTDLFELYDIQEKTKLVSRTLTLDWSEEEWLQVLVRRVLANRPFHRLAGRLRAADGTIEARAALEVLFPPEIEGQPVDRWLIESLRNGNGDISPRLAVLLLHLARDLSASPEGIVSTFPLFSAETAGRAMTRLSDLSFSEIINDFKMAPSFVQNCRVSKRDSFTLHQVDKLFDEAEGKISEQVRLLERLGFLERAVQEGDSGPQSLFRIPKLYTRCWDHA
jgi:energy-coupling factor transporter ATP-binding protein EcfA2